MPWWAWLAVTTAVVVPARAVFNRWMMAGFGVKASPAMLQRADAFMKRMIEVDQLITAGEVGQAMLVLDELTQRPELAEMPALAAQIHLNRARVASTLMRYDPALTSGTAAVAFYRQAYQRFRSASNASNLGEALQIVAQIRLRKGDTPGAIAAFEEIQRVSRRGAFRQTVVRTEIELSRLYVQIDEFDKAYAHAGKGFELAHKWGMADHAVEAIDFQAIARGSAGDYEGCKRLLDTAATHLRADAPLGIRAHNLSVRAGIAAEEGDLQSQVAVGGALLGIVAAIKTGRGWRQDQAETIQQFAELEQQTLDASYALAEQGDPQAAAVFLSTLGSLRESEIANVLRAGVMASDNGTESGLSTVTAGLFRQLAEVEDPDTPVSGSPAPLYERLETAVSARFRQAVQGSRTLRERVTPRYHYVQTRLISDDSGSFTLYGSWEGADRAAVLFTETLSSDQVEALHAVTGAADRRRPPAAGRQQRSEEARASTRGWAASKQYAALTGQDNRWRSLTSSLLPPELLEFVRDVPPNADDDAVPLIVFSPDNALWGLPWAALTIDGDGVLLGDRAAVALLPSSSLLRDEPTARRTGSRALSYLHGVDDAGLSVERTSLTESWPGSVDEAGDAAALVDALADMRAYSLLTMSVHGDNRPGLAHSLLLDPVRKTKLSAARMMSLSFPETVVVGACFSGSMDNRVGTEPLGIPSVMLCRGAGTVIGGLFPLPDGPRTGHATATILSLFYTLHAQGARPAWALRRAQQRWRAEHDSVTYTWAGLTALTNCDFP
jgi:tetratricopeptide (TPR) repeat protein